MSLEGIKKYCYIINICHKTKKSPKVLKLFFPVEQRKNKQYINTLFASYFVLKIESEIYTNRVLDTPPVFAWLKT